MIPLTLTEFEYEMSSDFTGSHSDTPGATSALVTSSMRPSWR